ncbi:MAG: methyltransferase domain-containing protein [Oceanipulchritudo sp.]
MKPEEKKEGGKDAIAFWEGRWRARETPWDHGRFAPPWSEFVEREGPPGGHILVPGAGSGHDVRYFAELGARVTGMDIAPSAIEVARERNPHPDAVYVEDDILNPDPALSGVFDWVVEHTCLCALDPLHWPAYAASVDRLLRPGGHYLALFYRDPEDDEGPPHRIEGATIDQLFGKRFSLLKSWIPERSYASRLGREELRWYLKPEVKGS